MDSQVRTALLLVGVMTLAGCQSLSGGSAPSGCGEIPTYADNVCLVDSWVAFGLEAQRGDDRWRDDILDEVGQSRMEQKAVRAVVLSWDGPSEWRQASNLYKAAIGSAPSRLQPLLQQWLNELEERRQLYARQGSNLDHGDSRQNDQNDAQALKRENEELKKQLKEMSDKLEALTDIERTINARD